MKLVTAVIKPHKWEDVREALGAAGIAGMTVTEASGHGIPSAVAQADAEARGVNA